MALLNTRRNRLLKLEEIVRESKSISLGVLYSKAVHEWGITEKTFWSYLEELKANKILVFDNLDMDTAKRSMVWRKKVKINTLGI